VERGLTVLGGWRRRRSLARRVEQLLACARFGLSLCPAAHPVGALCSCDRVGCPLPGMHPLSPAWQAEAATDPEQIAAWCQDYPRANFVSPTGIVHDVLDVPAPVGMLALTWIAQRGSAVGPVAASGDRFVFFTTTRGTPENEDEYWPSVLDCRPETIDKHPGLRWHCRNSYVLVPPSVLPLGEFVRWVRPPSRPLPDPLRVLEVLVDACDVTYH